MVEEDLEPREANRLAAEWKHHLREYFGEDLQRVNEARFALTRVLKEFNRGQNRWLARLEVQPCDISFLCEGGKRATNPDNTAQTRTSQWPHVSPGSHPSAGLKWRVARS